jgi:type I restriction-modification system DNA methylase subunit
MTAHPHCRRRKTDSPHPTLEHRQHAAREDGADEFRDYILGFIFYKYLSERIHLFADEILKHDGVTFAELDE